MAEENENKKEKKQPEKGLAILSYLGILFLVPWLAEKNNKFSKFHAKQGLILFLLEIASYLLLLIPVAGWIIAPIVWILCVVLLIIGIINVVNGKEKELPVIGQLAKKIKF